MKNQKSSKKLKTQKTPFVIPKFVQGMVGGAFVGIFVVIGMGNTLSTNALAISSPRDCDSNADITCGALTANELKQDYNSSKYKGVVALYSHFGISTKDVNAINKTAVAGKVHKDGRVTVGNKTVATGAVTAGRHNMPADTAVTVNGVQFYKRPPSVSFVPNSIAAFVVMENGQFQYAILGACGSPVKATPLKKPTPAPPEPATPAKPTPTPPTKPTTSPPPAQPEPPVSTQTPPSTPVAEVAVATEPAPTELPKTGPGAILIIAALSIGGGYFYHMTHRHIRHKRRTA